MKALKYYKHLKQEPRRYTILYKLFCFASIDAFVEEPTDEEYEILSEGIIDAYLQLDDCDLGKLADCVTEKYANREFTLAQFSNMSKWEVLDLYI